MWPGKAKTAAASGLVESALRGELTEAQARRLGKESPEVLALALLAASKRIAELQTQRQGQQPSPSTPSGMVPVYAKPNKSKRHKRPGAKPGHRGARRERPVKIDERKTHRLKCCPHCRGKLQHCERTRTRIIEDIPEVIEPIVTEHMIYRDYCPQCKKHVEPIAPDGMPKATFGDQMIALTRRRRAALDEASRKVCGISLYVLGLRPRSVREQLREATDTTGRDPAEERPPRAF